MFSKGEKEKLVQPPKQPQSGQRQALLQAATSKLPHALLSLLAGDGAQTARGEEPRRTITLANIHSKLERRAAKPRAKDCRALTSKDKH